MKQTSGGVVSRLTTAKFRLNWLTGKKENGGKCDKAPHTGQRLSQRSLIIAWEVSRGRMSEKDRREIVFSKMIW